MNAIMQPEDVYLSTAPQGYGAFQASTPELPTGAQATSTLLALRRLWSTLELDREHFGTAAWNPLAELIGRGKRVLIKPNWVRHEHIGGGSLDSLITHTSVLEAVLYYVMRTEPACVVVGDAPIQGCDFALLQQRAGIDELQESFSRRGMPIRVADFRRTILPGTNAWERKREGCRQLADYVLFDLGRHSELEPVSCEGVEFRVTMYDPARLKQAHAAGRHQYLIAREAMDAQVVLNLPKLKTHKKAGVTAALKNVVGINGHKEYLPHHRKGSTAAGGDCYDQSSLLKHLAENALDQMNASGNTGMGRFWNRAAQTALTAQRVLGGDGDVEGSWHGNDTIWRTCLDLQRILTYGRCDGTLADRPQRQVLHLTDAIIAGEGEGPMMPEAVPLGLLTLGSNVAAVDWVHAWLMGFDPQRIPLVRQSFRPGPFALAGFSPESLRVRLDGVRVDFQELSRRWPHTFKASAGWRGHCERCNSASLIEQQLAAA